MIFQCHETIDLRGEEQKAPQVTQRTEIKKVNSQVGTILKRKLSWFEDPKSGGCQTCNQKAGVLDANTPEWAETNIEFVVGWLMESAAKRTSIINIPGVNQFSRMVAKQIVESAIAEAKQIRLDSQPD